MSDAIVVEGVSRKFGDVVALDDIDFEVPAGTVFGLLGPNGAGKTTAVRVLATILSPDRGRAEVLGHDVVREAATVRSLIGLAGQYAAVDPNLTGAENLRLIGRLVHLPRPAVEPRARELLDLFGLADAADRPVRTYSGGCAAASTSRQHSSTDPRCCSSMSQPRASISRVAPICGR